MGVEIAIAAGKVVSLLLLLVLPVVALGVFFERKVSAVMQDRIGANRAAIFGFAGLGVVNTLIADPIKFLLKEDVVPTGVDHRLHFWAPIMGLIPAMVAFAVIPFGDTVEIAGRTIELQVANLDVGVLFVLAMTSLGVYGVVLGGWASNNRWSLLGGIRGSAQMISYEIAMGLALVAVVLTYGTLDLQSMVRQQGALIGGWLPAWGIFYQPIGMIVLLVAGIAESKRIPFDLPESESELVSGYFTEYSGAKHLMFMMADFVEVVLVAALVTTFFLGGWQVPGLDPTGLHLPGGAHVALHPIVVALLQITSFGVKLVLLTLFQIIVRFTLPRFRYDQLMRLGWKGLLPLALANVMLTAAAILWFGEVGG